MSDEIRVLFVDDSPTDLELIERELRNGGLVVTSEVVATEDAFKRAIQEFDPQLIICDYTLPGADGMVFLTAAGELCPDVPFIFCSGTIGEERAVEAMKRGATDYVLKDRLSALSVRVRRALREAAERRERQALEEQLRQAQKVEAIGRLAGGVAHDFNNLLTVIRGYVDISLAELPPESPVRSDLEEARDAADRAADLTRQLLAFSRRQIIEPRISDLNAIVESSEKLLRRLIGEDIEIAIVLNPHLGRAKVDRAQIEQVIVNLAINARDAMPQGGRLTFETDNVDLDNAYARAHTAVQPGPHVMLAVSDTGQGMDRGTLSHLFEPFFTTKEFGKGTGLGLATVYGIVKQSGGNIWVYSEPGRGTTFKIYLPRVDEPAEPLAPKETDRATLRGSETILVVEDEDAVRTLTRRVLESKGYTVLDANQGLAAIELAEKHDGPIHLLVTDVIMPQMSGRALAQALSAVRPSMRVLYVSGYTNNAIVHQGVLDPGTPFLQKPFTPKALASKVRDILD